MADTGIFATTAEVQRKVGLDANATANTEAYINDFISQAESFINVTCRRNFSDDYAGLNVDVKGILKEAASNLAAIYVLNYDYTSLVADSHGDRIQMENRINLLWIRFQECIKLLKEEKAVDFLAGA